MQNQANGPDAKERNLIAQQVFKPGCWLTKIETIKKLVHSNILITVLAEPASGKTTFINLLKSETETIIQTWVLSASSSFSEQDFLSQLSAALNKNFNSETTFASLAAQIFEMKVPILIIIDDAQFLTESFLQAILFELKRQGNEGFLHFCLVADHSLINFLEKFEQEYIQIIEPGNLTVSETKTYLYSILPAPKKLNKVMTEKELEKFYELTKGNIAAINTLISYFYPKSVLKSKDKTNYLLRTAGFLATAAVALVTSSYIWPEHFLPSSKNLNNHENTHPIAEIAQPLPSLIPEIPKRNPILNSQLVNISHEIETKGSQIPSWKVASTSQQVHPSPKRNDISIKNEKDAARILRDRVVVSQKNKKPALHSQMVNISHELATKGSQIPSWKVASTSQQVHLSNKRNDISIKNEKDAARILRDSVVVSQKNKKPTLHSQMVNISHELATKGSQIPSWKVASTSQQVHPSPKKIVDYSIDIQKDEVLVLRERIAAIEKILHTMESKPFKQKGTKTIAAKESILAKNGTLKRKQKIALDIKTTSKPFTIQLMASPDQAKLKRLITNLKLNEQVKIRLTKRNGVNWYVVTIGEYKQKVQATASIKNLPANLTQFNPWVRPLEQLKALG
ncbi:MAG: SPOR domain-containing protein [Tatlockia sp.]|nr:SPOR domain-containing protein [Tatlockia sp.]